MVIVDELDAGGIDLTEKFLSHSSTVVKFHSITLVCGPQALDFIGEGKVVVVQQAIIQQQVLLARSGIFLASLTDGYALADLV